jgi:hypothetical protein
MGGQGPSQTSYTPPWEQDEKTATQSHPTLEEEEEDDEGWGQQKLEGWYRKSRNTWHGLSHTPRTPTGQTHNRRNSKQ